MNDFLNAKSMVTPGVAGGLVMLISNTCAINFNLTPKWTALVLSALLGLLVVCIMIAPLWQKGLLWLFNALVIFSMAMGTNQAGATLQDQPETKHVTGPYPTPSASPVINPSPSTSASPAPTPRRIDPKAIMKIQQASFFKKW
jgi:hypothetical protein